MERAAIAAKRGEAVEDEENDLLEVLGRELREELRSGLKTELGAVGVPSPIINGVLRELETLLSHDDQTDDLTDESFKLEVTLPGTIVSGNFDELRGNQARWRWDGEALIGAEHVLEAVSVLENSSDR